MNYLFQTAWAFIKPFIPRKQGSGINLADFGKRMVAQLALAQKFGPIGLIIFGDSNAENLASIRWMLKFSEFGICVNIAVSGTRPDQWLEFFSNDPVGKTIFAQVQRSKIKLMNLGGNAVLQNQLATGLAALKSIQMIIPDSFNCLVAPIHYDILEKLSHNPNIEKEFDELNSAIQMDWQNHTIDTHTPFAQDPRIIWIVEGDLVHFNALGNKIRIPIIKNKIKAII